jgi:hypothetical protein
MTKQPNVGIGTEGSYGSETQHAAAERPERPVPTNRERVKHTVVEAHGATDIGHTPDQTARNHAQAECEGIGENPYRTVSKSSVTLGRHVTSKPGMDTMKQRKANYASARAAREKAIFGK